MNIEELAFKDRRELANLNVIDLLDIIELLQKDRKQWIYQFTNTFNESIKINEPALSLYKENQELKKQLEDMTLCRDIASGHREEVQDREAILLNQQKEFIKYLEDEKDRLARECSNIYVDGLGHTRIVNADIFDEVNDILQKYKEITGVKDENNIK